MAPNQLFYGDNLKILRHHIADESVDLVYLDPPFKSDQNYNVLFAEKNGTAAAAQIHAFEDTWHWDMAAAEAYEEVVVGGGRVSQVLQAFWDVSGVLGRPRWWQRYAGVSLHDGPAPLGATSGAQADREPLPPL
jgi:hypothetical protein